MLNNNKFELANIAVREVEFIHETHIIIHMDDNNRIKLYLCPDSQCCEEFGINVPKDLNSIIGCTICDFTHTHTDTYDEDSYKGTNMLNLMLETSENKRYEFMLFNEHNGYYPHDYEVIFTINKKDYTVNSGRL